MMTPASKIPPGERVTNHLTGAMLSLNSARLLLEEYWPNEPLLQSVAEFELRVGGRLEHWKSFPPGTPVKINTVTKD